MFPLDVMAGLGTPAVPAKSFRPTIPLVRAMTGAHSGPPAAHQHETCPGDWGSFPIVPDLWRGARADEAYCAARKGAPVSRLLA